MQYDRGPKHTAKIVIYLIQAAEINVLDWPSQSSDLNPIENLWSEFKRRVQQRKPQNLADLEAVCKYELFKITPNYCSNLIENYGNRLQQVIQQKGHSIRH